MNTYTVNETRKTPPTSGLCRLALCAGAALALATAASAQWQVVKLKPKNSSWSGVYGGDGGQQVGFGTMNGVDHAGYWSGSAGSWVDLAPGGVYSQGNCGENGKQYGAALVNNTLGACMWSGTAASYASLHPTGAASSNIWNASGGQQVGYADFGVGRQPALWSGTSGSYVDLSANGVAGGEALGVHGGHQVGFSIIGLRYQACMWSSTAASYISLDPGTVHSEAYGVWGNHQVGWVTVFAGGLYGNRHASLWSGTAESWVDINPAGAEDSICYSMFGDLAVGTVNFGGQDRAWLWNVATGTSVDLSSLLTNSLSDASAQHIWGDANGLYVGGWVFNNGTHVYDAVMWTIPYAPTPGSIALLGMAGVAAARRRRA